MLGPSALGGLLAGVRFDPFKAQDDPLPFIVSPHRETLRDGTERFSLGVLDLRSRSTSEIETGFMGHSVLADPSRPGRVVYLAQRPGRLACELDLEDGIVHRVFESGEGRHFYGHGAYSPDGRYLFSTENEIDTGKGIVVVRDGRDYKVLEELPSHGIGPHELKVLAGDGLAVICNGGSQTTADRPDFDVDAMRPTLTYVDLANGKRIREDALPIPRLSVRHLALTPQDDVAVGLKLYGPQDRWAPCLAFRTAGGPLKLARGPKRLMKKMGNSGFSLAIHESSKTLGVTHPDGGHVTFWDLRTHRFLKAMA
ncbi:MAG: DUF1513 domain-containing protein, partial [Planctomycetota bacterium]|nr:DUF1513 domain-containing protein [Planctomycetota bacterium]